MNITKVARINKGKIKHAKGAVTRVLFQGRGLKYVKLLALWLASFSVLAGSLLTELLKNVNYLEVFPKELLFPFFMHAVTATIVATVFQIVRRPKRFGAKIIGVIILSLILVDYGSRLAYVSPILKSFLPILPKGPNETAAISLVFFVLLFVIAFIIGRCAELLQRNNTRLDSRSILAGAAVFILAIYLNPFIKLVHIFPNIVKQSKVSSISFETLNGSTQNKDKPDIYYIVFDRYTNNSVLKEQFNYDNSSFTNYLKDRQFTVNENAHSNYPYTAISISSTLNASYTNGLVAPYAGNDVQSATLYHNSIRNSSVVRALKQAGYAYYSIGSGYGASNKAPLADIDYMYELALLKTNDREIKRLRGIELSQFKQSPYYSLLNISGISWWPIRVVEKDEVSYVREQMNNLIGMAESNNSGGRFIFAHILVPHDPFIFNADGSISDNRGVDNNGKPVKKKYTDQVQFINDQVKVMVDKILKRSDGKAVILLNSDEGPYPQMMNSTFNSPAGYDDQTVEGMATKEKMSTWSDDWLSMKFGILQAVHIPAANEKDIQNISSVNLFRIVLNRYAGYGLGYLPDCQYGLTHGKWYTFDYDNITTRFNSEASNTCEDYSTVKQ